MIDIYLFIFNIQIKKKFIDFNIKESVGKFTKQNKIEKFSPNELILSGLLLLFIFIKFFYFFFNVYDFQLKWGKHIKILN